MNLRALLCQGVLVTALLVAPFRADAQVSIGVSVHVGPPALPVYVQPPCPAPNYIWTPGYWAWGPDGYYWVPGTWVMAPTPGLLWTPGYWGWGAGGVYVWNAGYWGTHVGFYGGINYGFGYGGVGFVGGEWRGGTFAYNTAVVNVNRTVVHNTYVNTTVINNYTTINRTSFNGGPNGVAAHPTPQQQAFASERRVPLTQAQVQHEQVAGQDRANLASVNRGIPVHAAVARPATNAAELGHAVPAKAANPHPAQASPHLAQANPHQSGAPSHPKTAGVHPGGGQHPGVHPQNENKPEHKR